MTFNKNIDGNKNEYEFIKYLNLKKVKELNPMFLELIETLFTDIDKEDYIYCDKIKMESKGDIKIKINNQIKIISIKKGVKNSIHIEPVEKFIEFLKYYTTSEEVINNFLEYHYADGTTNGTGEQRISAKEYKINNQEKIDKINKRFNTKFMLHRACYRFVFKGIHHQEIIDALIFGVVEDFIWATREELEKIILSKVDEYSTEPHFGPLSIQPWSRCLNHNSKYERCRHFIQVKWYNLADDIINIMANYRNNQK